METYLLSYSQRNEGPIDHDLLWKYYVRGKKYASAARALVMLAESTELDISLQKRVEYLSLAVTNAKCYSPQAGERISTDFLRDLEDKLDVASIQLQIYKEIEQLTDGSDVALNELQRSLFPISDLYNKYARPLRLHLSSLAILNCSGYNDPALVRQLWSELIASELRHVSATPNLIECLSTRIRELAQKFYPSEIAFPLGLVCGLLERASLDHQVAEKDWVIRILLSAGVRFSALHDTYRQMVSAKAGWQEPSVQLHLLRVLYLLIQRWLRQSQTLAPSDREPFPAKTIEDSVTSYICDLDQRQADEARVLSSDFKALHRQIRQLF